MVLIFSRASCTVGDIKGFDNNSVFSVRVSTKASRVSEKELIAYWLMKWLKLLHHWSGLRNVGGGFLEQNHNKYMRTITKAFRLLHKSCCDLGGF